MAAYIVLANFTDKGIHAAKDTITRSEKFKEMAKQYPAEVGPMRELRHTLGQLRLNELAVGPDGRNRCLLSVFRSRTGRNQPSNS